MTSVSVEPMPAGPGPTERRAPDFFIVGHPKCGTTALYEMLRRQPRIFMPSLKEPHFLAGEIDAQRGGVPRTLEEYLALFADAGPEQLLGEASPSYLNSPSAAANIAALQPQARIIAILREPASFLRSWHLQLLQSHVETEADFATAISREQRELESPAEAQPPRRHRYSDRVRYVEQLRRYRELFGSERVLVLIYDDFRDDNEGTVREVLRFLEVDDALPVQAREANPTVRLRSKQLDVLIHRATVGRGPVMRGVKVGVKAVTTRRMRHGALGMRRSVVYGEADAPDERVMLELRRRFRGEVVALSEYLGRDLVTLWGYDSLD
jgi:hypothetical protein